MTSPSEGDSILPTVSRVTIEVEVVQTRADCLMFNANTLADYLVGLEGPNGAEVVHARVLEVRS